jgi:hypothetical protein
MTVTQARIKVRREAAGLIAAMDLAQLVGEGENEVNTLKEKDEAVLEQAQRWLVRRILKIDEYAS